MVLAEFTAGIFDVIEAVLPAWIMLHRQQRKARNGKRVAPAGGLVLIHVFALLLLFLLLRQFVWQANRVANGETVQ